MQFLINVNDVIILLSADMNDRSVTIIVLKMMLKTIGESFPDSPFDKEAYDGANNKKEQYYF